MDKGLLAFIIVVIILAIVATVLLSVFLKPKNTQKFKVGRDDELEKCHDICFEKFPFQWDFDDRQQCLSECLEDEKLMKSQNTLNLNWIDKMSQCVNQKCTSF